MLILRPARWLALFLLFPLGACGPLEEVEDVEEEGTVTVGKADGITFSPCVSAAMLALVNDQGTGVAELRGLGVASTAAKNLIAHRDGPDTLPGTGDDDPFDDLAELDAVKYVGPLTLKRLATAVEAECQQSKAEVVFSPQPYAQSHVAKLVPLIDASLKSLDIAMYNLSDSNVQKALQRAVQRGVKVRFISEDANADAKSPAGTKSAALEDLGFDVRYVNKIMHHKFLLVDGPRSDIAAAQTAGLVTGSANWSSGGATRYDENTVFLSQVPRLALAYQAEFNLLWEHAHDFVWKPYPFETGVPIDRAAQPPDPATDAAFTSDNFTVKPGGTTFYASSGKNTVADLLVKEIMAAKSSIHIASGHLRSRPVSEALMAAKKANPALDIKVYLDQQEYISASGHADQVSELQKCMAAAGTSVAKQEDCQDRGFLYSYAVTQAGIDLKYKVYAYRWDYSYAKQMHNKYFIFDGKTLVTGSYNLSDNAEHNTFENVAVLRAPAYAALIAKFEGNFAKLWATDGSGTLLAALTEKIKTAPEIPIVFDPMALTWQQMTSLKQLIAQNCPAVNSEEFRTNAAKHFTCPRP
jgi:phosphatidylserine/phosphatidylglycerophosphate/cardiolipin synthase-like enzyme